MNLDLGENFKFYFWKIFRFFGYLFLFFAVLVFMISQEWLGKLPSIEEIKNPKKSISSVIYTSDHVEMGKYFIENRTELNFSQIPKHTIDALLATEDNRFYSHSGVDIRGVISALFRTFILGKRSGASTITQQLAKNLFHNSGRKNIFVRPIQKLKEWYIAIQLERNFSKDEILAIYLNTVPFLHNSFGIKEAAKTYFNKDVSQLLPQESAILIGMLKGPSVYNPKSKPENAIKRRNVVLDQMLKYQYISPKLHDSLIHTPLVVNYQPPSHNTGLAPYLREEIRMQVNEILINKTKPDGSSYNIYSDGLKIYTTIDSRMQKYAESAVDEHMRWLQAAFDREWGNKDPYKYGDRKNPDLVKNIVKETEEYQALITKGKTEREALLFLEGHKRPMTIYTRYGTRDTMMSLIDSIKYYKRILQTGLCALDPMSGRILAWVGGIDFEHFQLDHVRMSTRRQVGSTIKPLLYAAAIDNGETPCSEVEYSKPQIPGFEDWDPKGSKNFTEGSLVSLKDGLQVSDNRIAAQLIKRYGVQSLTDMARNLGVEAPIDAVPSIALGVTDISVYEMIGAYTPFMDRGIYHKPYYIERIENANGHILYQATPEAKEALNPRTALLVNLMMQNVSQGKGTAARLRNQFKLTMEIACKTGTTQSNTDGWFIGGTPQLLCAVWVGADDPAISFASTSLGQGASSALPIWAKFVSKCYSDPILKFNPKASFIKPADSSIVIEMNCIKVAESELENEYDDVE